MPASKLWGSQFLVNTTVKSNQEDVELQALKDGSFLAVWRDASQTGADTSGSAIRAQIFNADGTKRGGEFLVNTTTLGDQYDPSVTLLNDGRFVVTWMSDEGGDRRIMARAYQADGTAIGNDFQLSASANIGNSGPELVALSDGGFAIAFYDDDDVVVQSFNTAFQAVGVEARIDRPATGGLFNLSITAIQGRYVVGFQEWGNTSSVHQKIFNNDGSVPAGATEFIATGDNEDFYYPASATLANGSTLFAWFEPYLNAENKSVQTLKAQILNPDGSKQGVEFTLQSSIGEGKEYWGTQVVQLADGGFAVAYYENQDGRNSTDLYLSVFNSAGVKVAPDTVVAHVFDAHGDIALTALADGRVTVAWQDYYNTLDNMRDGVVTQIVDVRQKAVVLDGTAANDHYIGTDFGDKLAGGLGADKLLGEAGKDKLYGGTGNDVLTGGLGKDIFVFNSALGTYRTDRLVNFDTITDFNVKDDSFWLDNAVFRKLGRGTESKPGKLNKDFFVIGSKDKNDYLVYDNKKGVLLYDADGSGKGKAVEIATLAKNLKMTEKDFFVI